MLQRTLLGYAYEYMTDGQAVVHEERYGVQLWPGHYLTSLYIASPTQPNGWSDILGAVHWWDDTETIHVYLSTAEGYREIISRRY